ncbi:nucleotide exchange factor GrpE [Kordia algicida OT-1]|uniref:Protein GrpE n=1 Tax=Kordia algicida OT-1 TaxID=391587 RepID=A9E716_9FLAO|nr:nucleotide exchange factor GrpE [Kordia algicida]EDP94865.1 molecular chaperone, heat shock protein [Kordia algicida OT-1]
MSKKNDHTTEKEQPKAQTEATQEETKTAETTENTVEEVSAEAKLQEELAKEKDKFLRLFAEFENYKKRTSKERVELFKTASKDVVVAMLPVLDDFDRALTEIAKTDAEDLKKGVELISNKLRETLKAKGLGEVEVKAGDTFDAEDHEAVTQIPAPSDDMKGKIIDVLEKGYTLGDKVIRYPKVVVGQ